MVISFADFSSSRVQPVGITRLSPAFSISVEGGDSRTWTTDSLFAKVYDRERSHDTDGITKQQQGILIRFPINLSTAKAFGIEFSAKQRLLSGLSLRANMNFYHSKRNGKYQSQIFSSEAQSLRARMRLRWDFSGSWHYQ